MAPRVPMMRMKEYTPIFSCLLLELLTSRPQQASATALMPFAPLILEAAQGGVPARLLSLKQLDFLASSQQERTRPLSLASCKLWEVLLPCACAMSFYQHVRRHMQTRPRSQICKCCMQCTCNCKIRPVLAAAATASEFNTTSILVQRLFSGDLEIYRSSSADPSYRPVLISTDVSHSARLQIVQLTA